MIKCKEVVSSQSIKIVLVFSEKVAISLFRSLSATFTLPLMFLLLKSSCVQLNLCGDIIPFLIMKIGYWCM